MQSFLLSDTAGELFHNESVFCIFSFSDYHSVCTLHFEYNHQAGNKERTVRNIQIQVHIITVSFIYVI